MHLQVVLKKRRNRSSVEMFRRQCSIRDRWHWTEEYSVLYLALFGTCVSLTFDRCATVSIRVQADGRPTGQLDPGFTWFTSVVEHVLCCIILLKPPY